MTAVGNSCAVGTTDSPRKSRSDRSEGWLISPLVDTIFVANIVWPILVIASGNLYGHPIDEALGFTIAYFIIMPHRWITLALVFLDKKRIEQDSRRYYMVGMSIILFACLTQLSLGTLTLLLAIDFLWTAWHFAAQHGGIARIYERQARPDSQTAGTLDKIVLRTLVLFAVMRLAGTSLPAIASGQEWLKWIPPLMVKMSWCDWVVLAMPLGLIVRELIDFRPSAFGRFVYLTSVTTLYCLMIVAVRMEWTTVKIGCAAAGTFFHSIEYLAIVSWNVQKNKSLHAISPFRYLVPRWTMFLLFFMAFCALSAFFLKQPFFQLWVLVNLIISFMHYAYDGMIWKRPKKKSAPAMA